MRHVPDGTLRRLVDEPLAVPDVDVEHVRRCRRCQVHRERVSRDAHAARVMLVRPQGVPDLDRAWDRLGAAGGRASRRVPHRVRPRPLVGATGVAAVSAVAVTGVAAAATLTVVLSPTHVAPLPVSTGDLHDLAAALGLDAPGPWGGQSVSASGGSTSAPTSRGSAPTWKYGTIDWSARPQPVQTTSLQAAEAAAGMTVGLPTDLPAGVGPAATFLAVPQTSVTITFGAAAGPALAGSAVTLHLGAGILAEYGGAATGLGRIPTLVVAAMQRPTATSTGVSITQLESFVLDRPGFPADLAREVRLLGNLRSALPVPVPSGVTETSTSIAGSPAVLLSAVGGTATGVVWEDAGGTVRTVGGLLDQQDVLAVARQLG